MNATKEIVDTEAPIEQYRDGVEDLEHKLEEKEKEVPARSRRLSAREAISASVSFFAPSHYVCGTKLILTSQTVEGVSQPGSPVEIGFGMSSYRFVPGLSIPIQNCLQRLT